MTRPKSRSKDPQKWCPRHGVRMEVSAYIKAMPGQKCAPPTRICPECAREIRELVTKPPITTPSEPTTDQVT